MSSIQIGELPQDALLNKYKLQGAYTDCYFMDIPGTISQSQFVQTFYTTALFKVERNILALVASRPSNDMQATQLANGQTSSFAAWSVEDRCANQLLLCDFLGRTRSWLMSNATGDRNSANTRLYFGSAVVPKSTGQFGEKSFGFAFHALKGFHSLYTRALMQAALTKLSKS